MSPFRFVCFLLVAFMGLLRASACPWCKNSPLQSPTVTTEMGDPGGKFFGRVPPPENTRHYFIAAEPGEWRFMPKGSDPVGRARVPERFLKSNPIKLRYVQYTDQTFSVRANQSEHLGILGPVLRARTGEFIAVTFLNKTDRPLSMHPHGVKYDKDSEGSSYFPERGLGAAIAPGAHFTYVWHADQSAGPKPDEPSSKPWLYHSHVLGHEEINLGLVGFILVTDPKRARPDGTPSDIDRELATAFMVFDESPREDEDLSETPLPADPVGRANFIQHRVNEAVSELQKAELGLRHSVNGRIFGNLDGLEMIEGDRVRWYLFALGSEKDLHTAHWHGTRVNFNGRTTDVVELLPGSMAVADFTAESPGSWLFHCHVADHMMEGMYAPFVVHPAKSTNALSLSGSARYSAALPAPSLRIDHAAVEKLEGRTFLRTTMLCRMNTMPPLAELPVHLKIAEGTWSFCLNDRGEASSKDGASIRVAMNQAGSGAGVEMKVTLLIPEESFRTLPKGKGQGGLSIPVELHLDRVSLTGNLYGR